MLFWFPRQQRTPWCRFLCAFLVFVSAQVSGLAGTLQWVDEGGYRWATVTPKADGRDGFVPMDPSATGVLFTNMLPIERHSTNQILLNGSGVTAGDVDGDGWCDIFFGGLGGGSRLYRNLRDWKFKDVTVEAGLLACTNLDATGVALVDLDGDGDLDLVVNSVGQGTHCFRNDGSGHFAEFAVLNQGRGGSSLAFGDIDGDGKVDLYVANIGRRRSGISLPHASRSKYQRPAADRRIWWQADYRSGPHEPVRL